MLGREVQVDGAKPCSKVEGAHKGEPWESWEEGRSHDDTAAARFWPKRGKNIPASRAIRYQVRMKRGEAHAWLVTTTVVGNRGSG